MEQENTKESILLKWSAPEFVKYKRDWKWFLLAIVSGAIIFGYSIYAKDWFIIFITVFLAAFLFYSLRKEPIDVQYKITALGIYVNGKLYPYNEIHSFWLVLNSDQKILNIMFNKKYIPELKIIFYGIDPLELKLLLSKYIPEQEDRSESLADRLIRILKLN